MMLGDKVVVAACVIFSIILFIDALWGLGLR